MRTHAAETRTRMSMVTKLDRIKQIIDSKAKKPDPVAAQEA